MNYKCYCHSNVECTIEKTNEEEGEYYDDDARTYYVFESFSKAKKFLLELVKEERNSWRDVTEIVRNLKITELEYSEEADQ